MWKSTKFIMFWMFFVVFLLGGAASAQDFVVDFSRSSGFGKSADTVQINNIMVTIRVHNPLTGEDRYLTDSYNVIWRWDPVSLVLRPVAIATTGGPTCNDASLEVIVTNALTGEPIPGATVTVSGKTEVSQSDGRVSLTGLPGGNVQISVSAQGFLPQTSTVSLSCGSVTSVGISLLPANNVGTARGDIRIILTWGEKPEDLDSHLTGPRADNPSVRFHIYYDNSNNCGESPCDPGIPAWLDVDDTDSYGPETITITKVNGRFVPGRYRYSVHHYSGESNIPHSLATVKIFIGNRLVRTYTPPASGLNVGEDWAWVVCDIMIDNQGNISIRDVNRYIGPVNSDDSDSFN